MDKAKSYGVACRNAKNAALESTPGKAVVQDNTTNRFEILDLCSGSAGPIPESFSLQETKHGLNRLKLTMIGRFPLYHYGLIDYHQ